MWSSDGAEIFYLAGPAVVSVPVQTRGDPLPGRPSEVFRMTDPVFFGEGRVFDAHPDGSRFIWIRRSRVASAPADELVIVQNRTGLLGGRSSN